MSYTALYRKFRPKVFEDVKGQEPIVTTLRNQIKNERTTHAYLFCGTRGTGKTTIAKIFAKAVNCESPIDGSPCGECPMCKGIQDGSSMNVIELDAASNNGVDSIREIVEEVTYSPTAGRYKVYIIDEVHMLSTGAFNALLKTLEEPPSYVIFILATTEPHKLPITILSRCQRYDFRRISIDTIGNRIRELTSVEGVDIEEKAVNYIARQADGSMRDALSLLDQCIAFYFGQKLSYDNVLSVLGAVDTTVFSQLIRCVLDADVAGALKVLEEIVIQGRELGQFITDLTWYLRNMLLLKTAEANEDIIDLSSDNMARLKEEAALADEAVIIRYIRILSDLSGQLKYASAKRVLVEIALIKLCRPQMEEDTQSLVDRIRQLEMRIEQGIPVVMSQGGSAAVRNESISLSQSEQPKVQRDIALPEDIKEAAAKWDIIISECNCHHALIGSYPSIEGDDTLAIITKEPFVDTWYSDPAKLEALREDISRIIDKDIKITLRCENGQGNSGNAFPDVRAFIEENIDFEIEEIDSEDEDDDDEPEIEDLD